MKQLRICSSLNLHQNPGEEISAYIKAGLAFHKKMGFDAADLSLEKMGLAAKDWQVIAEQALEDAREVGIRIEQCHLPFSTAICKKPELLPAFCEKMHHAIDAAVFLGVEYAVLHPNTTTLPLEDFDRTAQYDTVMNHLAPFIEHGNRVGLNIVVENMRVVHGSTPVHRYCQDPDELCDIADALGIGVCWDFGHAHISGVTQSEGLAYVGKRLKVLHVNDNFADDDIHLPPFIGTLNWRDAMHGLALAEFDGRFNYELSTGRVPANMKEQFARYIVAAARELMTYIE